MNTTHLSWVSARCLCRFLWSLTLCRAASHSPSGRRTWAPWTLLESGTNTYTHTCPRSFIFTTLNDQEPLSRSQTQCDLWPVAGIWSVLQEPWWLWWKPQRAFRQQRAVDTCGTEKKLWIPVGKKKRTEGNNRQQQSSHLRKDIVGTFLLQFLAESESKETDGKHGCDPNDGGCHASVKSCHALWLQKQNKRVWKWEKCLEMFYKFNDSCVTSLAKVFLKQSIVPV